MSGRSYVPSRTKLYIEMFCVRSNLFWYILTTKSLADVKSPIWSHHMTLWRNITENTEVIVDCSCFLIGFFSAKFQLRPTFDFRDCRFCRFFLLQLGIGLFLVTLIEPSSSLKVIHPLLPTCFNSSLEPASCITQNSSSKLFIATFIWTLLSPSITFSLFHSELKTYLFRKSYPPP